MNSPNIIFNLQVQARARPNYPALIYEKEHFSYAKLYELVKIVASSFSGMGIKSGDVVALSFQSEFLYALSILANAMIGATSLCISDTSPLFQKLLFTKQARCNRFLTDSVFAVQDEIPWKIVTIKDLIQTNHVTNFNFQEFPKHALILAIGSGSTGEKKLMSITHQVMRNRCASALGDPALSEGSRLLCLSSLAFISVVNRLFNSIYSGTTFVLLDRKSGNVFEFIESNSINSLMVSVFHLEDLLKKIQFSHSEYFKNKINVIRCVGSLLSDDLKRRVHDVLNINIINSYATNESGVICRTSLPVSFKDSLNVGIQLPDVNVQIVNSEDRVLEAGQRGYIRIATPGLIDGYLYNQEFSKNAFRDGWFYPGDIGEFSSEGNLLFYGRSDRMMICNGVNIFPAEIENALITHPSIADCIVFPIKNPIVQDIPVCAVSLKKDCIVDESDLISWLAFRLGFSTPRRVFILQSLPKTVEGKIQLSDVFDIINSRLKNGTIS